MSRPRTIGRLAAPGAKLEPVMPGLANKRSPNVLPPLRLISSSGTTVTVAKRSVTIGSVPISGAAAGAAGTATASAGRLGGGRRTASRGAVMLICGSASVSSAARSRVIETMAIKHSDKDRNRRLFIVELPNMRMCNGTARAGRGRWMDACGVQDSGGAREWNAARRRITRAACGTAAISADTSATGRMKTGALAVCAPLSMARIAQVAQ